VPAPQLAWPVLFGFDAPPPPAGAACAVVPPAFAVDVVVAAAVVVAGAVVAAGAAVVGVAVLPVVAATPSAGWFALQLAAALALGAAVALGVALAGASDGFESPPHATMTAEVPSAARVVARFVSERFGRILMFSFFSSSKWRVNRG
jgi:hypothetical protein